MIIHTKKDNELANSNHEIKSLSVNTVLDCYSKFSANAQKVYETYLCIKAAL